MMGDSLWSKVQKINEALRAGEPGNISIDTHTGWIGYDAQAIYDAVNEHIGPEHWYYRVHTIEDDDKHVIACVSISILTGTDWLEKGNQYGNSVISKAKGDAIKGAITDALKKCFSAWSIGNRAFLGLLVDPKTVKNVERPVARPPAQPRPAAPPVEAVGGTATRQQLFTALEECGLLVPDPTEEYPDRQKPSGEYYGVCEKVGLPKSWSKYTPEQYATAISACKQHVKRHAEPGPAEPELPMGTTGDPAVDAMPDPFSDE